MSEKEARPQEFEPLEGGTEGIITALNHAGKSSASATVWTQSQEGALRSHLTLVQTKENAFCIWLPKNFDIVSMLKVLAKNDSDDCFVTLGLPTANLFFKSQYLSHSTTDVRLSIPKEVYKIQRRHAIRFPIPSTTPIFLELPNPVDTTKKLKKKLFDISAGGLSFVISDEEKAAFNVGIKLTNLKFMIRGKPLVLEGEVKHAKKNGDKATEVKIGVQFINLSSADSNSLASYVFEESRKFYSKFL